MKWLLRLYPRRWRARYQDEMLAVLEEHGVGLRTRINLLRGALDAHFTLRRDAMLGKRRPTTLWIIRLALIPAVIMAARFLTDLYFLSGNATIAEPLGSWVLLIGVVAWLAVSAWSGAYIRRIGGGRRDAAITASLTGVIAWAMSWLVGWLLNIAGLAGLYDWAMAFSGGRISGYVNPAAITMLVHGLVDPRVFLPLVGFALASALGGAALGIAGWQIYASKNLRLRWTWVRV